MKKGVSRPPVARLSSPSADFPCFQLKNPGAARRSGFFSVRRGIFWPEHRCGAVIWPGKKVSRRFIWLCAAQPFQIKVDIFYLKIVLFIIQKRLLLIDLSWCIIGHIFWILILTKSGPNCTDLNK